MKLVGLLVLAAGLLFAPEGRAAEKVRVAYPAVAPGLAPSWVTADTGIWRKHGLDVETILVSGGARAVPALISNSVQFLIGSDTGITIAQLKGIPVVRIGVTLNTLGSSLITSPNMPLLKIEWVR